MPTKTPAKKVAAKKAPAKKAPAAKKAAAKAPAVDAAKREKESAARRATVVKMRKAGKSIAEIASELGRDSVSVGVDYIYATEERAGQPLTAARVKKERDAGAGWIKIAARYSDPGAANVTKAQVQKLYTDAGGDVRSKPERPAKSAPVKKAAATTAKATSAAKKKGAAKVIEEGTSVFGGEETKDEVIAKIEGKTITVQRNHEGLLTEDIFKVKTVKAVGKSGKLGTRAVAFFDAKTGGERTIALDAIVKVSR